MRRKFLKFFTSSLLAYLLLPYKIAFSVTKKIINKNLTNQQKNILFNEGTERPFSSSLLHEKREGYYHCANCGAKLFSSKAKFDSGTGWPSFSESLPGAFKTNVDYALPVAGNVDIKIINIVGQVVETLVDEHMSAGFHTVSWDASSIPSGLYFITVESGMNVSTQKLMLMK